MLFDINLATLYINLFLVVSLLEKQSRRQMSSEIRQRKSFKTADDILFIYLFILLLNN